MVWDGGLEPRVVLTRWALLGVALGGAPVWPSSGGVGFTEKSPPCRDYKRLRPSVPNHLITSVLHHLIGWFGHNRAFFHEMPT